MSHYHNDKQPQVQRIFFCLSLHEIVSCTIMHLIHAYTHPILLSYLYVTWLYPLGDIHDFSPHLVMTLSPLCFGNGRVHLEFPALALIVHVTGLCTHMVICWPTSIHIDAPPMWQHVWKCAQQQCGRAVARQAGGMAKRVPQPPHTHNPTHTHLPSITCPRHLIWSPSNSARILSNSLTMDLQQIRAQQHPDLPQSPVQCFIRKTQFFLSCLTFLRYT